MPENLENLAVAIGLEKVSFHSNPKERQCQRMLKLLHNCTHLTNSKVMLKILQVRLQQYMNQELPDGFQAGFRKGRGTREQIANMFDHRKSKGVPEKIYSCFIDYAKAFDCVDHNKLENSSRDRNTRPSYLSPEKYVCRSRNNS